MEQLILWFNILGFSFLFASLGTAYFVYASTKPRWLNLYLLYLGIYAFFTLFNTYSFFSEVYLPPMKPLFFSLVMFTTFFIAFVLLNIVPQFIFTLLPRGFNAHLKILTFIITGIFIILMFLSYLNPEWGLNRIGSVLLNGYLGILTFYALIRLRNVNNVNSYGVVIPFLYLSGFFYLIVSLQSIIQPIFISPSLNNYINILTGGIISFLWGITTLSYMIIKKHHANSISIAALTDIYIKKYGITPREKEIISLLMQGKSNKEISDRFFVSHRTVETHIYNIYRKCGVKNKLELAHHITLNS